MFIHSSNCFKNPCCVGHLEGSSLSQKCQWHTCIYFLLTWYGICCHFYHPSAGEMSSFKTSISKCPPTFCYMGLPPWGSIFGLPLGKKPENKPQQNSGEPFCLEMEAIKLDGKAHISHSVMRISFQWNTEIKLKKKSLIFVGFTSTVIWLWRSPYL